MSEFESGFVPEDEQLVEMTPEELQSAIQFFKEYETKYAEATSLEHGMHGIVQSDDRREYDRIVDDLHKNYYPKLGPLFERISKNRKVEEFRLPSEIVTRSVVRLQDGSAVQKILHDEGDFRFKFMDKQTADAEIDRFKRALRWG